MAAVHQVAEERAALPRPARGPGGGGALREGREERGPGGGGGGGLRAEEVEERRLQGGARARARGSRAWGCCVITLRLGAPVDNAGDSVGDDYGARLQLLRELRVAMRLAEEERLLVEPALVERAWPG